MAREKLEACHFATQSKNIHITYTVFTNGGHAGKNWCLVMKARRWRINKNEDQWGGGGEETRSGTVKGCSHNLQSAHPAWRSAVSG